MKNRPAALALLAAAVLAVYGMVLGGPVVHDDQTYVQSSVLLRRPPAAFAAALLGRDYFVQSGEATYQPVVTAIHYFTWSRPPVYRLLGLLLHALNAFLVLLLAERLGLARGPALLAALLFAFFPADTEAVDISSYKGHVLGLTFTAACVLAWAKALEPGRRAGRWAAACAGFFAAGLLCKETVLLTPFFLEGYRRLIARRPLTRQTRWGLAALGLIAAAYSGWRFFGLTPLDLPLRRWQAPVSFLGWYVRLMAWPAPLCLQRALEPGWAWRACAAAFLLAGFAARRRPAVLFAWFWTAAALLPALRLWPFASANPVADRYLYGASAGLALILAAAFGVGRARWGLFALLTVWGVLTISRNGLYRDEQALAEQTFACAPDSASAAVMLGGVRLRQGRYPEARDALERATRLDPAVSVAWNNLAIAECFQGDYDDGIAHFRRAIAAADGAQPRNNLGKALAARKRYAEALAEFAQAKKLRPEWSEPDENAAAVRRLMGAR